MPDESQALSTIPAPVPEETDYDAICAAVMQTERGRWFLQEYARRNRNADTQLVLAAVERLETVIRTEHARASHADLQSDLVAIAKAFALPPGPEPEEISAEPQPTSNGGPAPSEGHAQPGIFETAARLQGLALTMRERGLDPATGTQIDALAAAILSAPSMRDPGDPRAEKLAAVLAQLERRIEAMLVDAASPTGAIAEPSDASAEVGPSTAVSPAPATLDQPAPTPLRLGLPAEATGKPRPVPAEALPPAPAGDAAQIDDELFATLPVPGETRAAPIISAQPASSTPAQPATASRPVSSTGRIVAAAAGATAGDPLAALKAMSDEERIALFT